MTTVNDDSEAFATERAARVLANSEDAALTAVSREFMLASVRARYSYNFDYLGRPIIQYPQDIVAIQELIWRVRPDLVIETGIARGGSLLLSASMLALLDYCDAAGAGEIIDPRLSRRRVLGIDIDIRTHNKAAIESHPLAGRISMLQGSSTDALIVSKVRTIASAYQRIMVCLDSNHTTEHVLAELEAYAPLVSDGSYCVVFDTVIADLPEVDYHNRPWNLKNNPQIAVDEYLARLERGQTFAADRGVLQFVRDRMIDGKLLVSVAPRGYLRRVGVTSEVAL